MADIYLNNMTQTHFTGLPVLRQVMLSMLPMTKTGETCITGMYGMGMVVWQLNDCWPVASWSSIDYCGRWKALYYYEKRCFAPILLSCAEEGVLTQDANPNAEPYEVKKSIHLNVANDLLLADNYFDMNAGEKQVKILGGEPVGLRVRSVYDIR